MTTEAWAPWMRSLIESEGLATASGLASLEGLGDDDRRHLQSLLDAAVAALAAEDAALRSAFAHPRWELRALPPERRSARGLAHWVFEHVLVYTIFRSWVRLAPVVWDEVEPSSPGPNPGAARQRPDLIVFDESWQTVRFALEARWWVERAQGLVLDAPKLRERAEQRGGRSLLMTFSHGRRRDLEASLRAMVLPDDVVPVHLGTFPCEVYTRWEQPSWREPGCFTVLTFDVG